MKRIPFEIVEIQLNKMINDGFSLKEEKDINNHCEYMTQFVESCGWSIEDYIRRMFNFDNQYN